MILELVQKALKTATAEQVQAAIEQLGIKEPNANHVPAIVDAIKSASGLAVAKSSGVGRGKRSKNAVEKVSPAAAVAAADPTEQLNQGAADIEVSATAMGYNVGTTLVAAKQRGFVNGLNQALVEGQSSTAALFSAALDGAIEALL